MIQPLQWRWGSAQPNPSPLSRVGAKGRSTVPLGLRMIPWRPMTVDPRGSCDPRDACAAIGSLKNAVSRATSKRRESFRPSRIDVFSGNASSPEILMFGFQGSEAADVVARKNGLHERRPAKMEVPDELRLLDDQDQGPIELNDPNTIQHFGGAGRPWRRGLDARQAVLTAHLTHRRPSWRGLAGTP